MQLQDGAAPKHNAQPTDPHFIVYFLILSYNLKAGALYIRTSRMYLYLKSVQTDHTWV